MSNSDTDEIDSSMSFADRHEQTLELLKEHQKDMINYHTIIRYLNILYDKCSDTDKDVEHHVSVYILFLHAELRTIRNKPWIKENKHLFTPMDSLKCLSDFF